MLKKNFKVTAETGLHARPATILVSEATKFESEIFLESQNKIINLKSIMGIMSLGVYKVEEVSLIISGRDEQEAMISLTECFMNLNLGKEL